VYLNCQLEAPLQNSQNSRAVIKVMFLCQYRKKRDQNARSALYIMELSNVCLREVIMIIFAAIVVLILIFIAFAGLICALFDADDLRNMGVRF
jgi:hypothetical protein